MVRRNVLTFVRALGISLPRFNEKYLDRVRGLSCSVCGAAPRSEAQHPRGAIWGTGGNLKAPDETAIPLCHFHHCVEYHGINRGAQTWEARYGTHLSHLQKTYRRLGLEPPVGRDEEDHQEACSSDA